MTVSPRTLRRLAIAGTCVVSLAICCGLAWWQWDRFTSAGGSFQNLGYVLQWPLFGLFPAFMFWRIRTLNRAAADALPGTDAVAEPAEQTPPSSQVARREAAMARPAVEEEDDELAAYNRYLAELNSRDQKSG